MHTQHKHLRTIQFLWAAFVLFLGAGVAQNPVLPGDHPDPSIIRVGHTYWASATSGDWSPSFPLFQSEDLHTWRQVGSIFAAPPSWASGSFWAPELVNDGGVIRAYYVARKKQGPLCVAVATAPSPAGPYTDHGPLVCQPDGSIDPAFVRDAQGHPYLIWKEDGNSQRKPTPIFAQPMSQDGLALQGQPTQLITNDSPWEGAVTEAPYIFHHGGYFYLLYAGGACCGRQCTYAEGVARARHVLGPWQKDPANPFIRENAVWQCPGHGTAVETAGAHPQTYFLFHAYLAKGGTFLARESVLEKLAWRDNWPVLETSDWASAPAHRESLFEAPFAGSLEPGWQWPLNDKPQLQLAGGRLTLSLAQPGLTAMLGRVITGDRYEATVTVESAHAFAGLGVLGDEANVLAIGVQDGQVVLWKHDKDGAHVLARGGARSGPVQLRVSADEPANARFWWRVDSGSWQPLGNSLQTQTLLGWDRGLRLGVVADGTQAQGVFRSYRQKGEQ